MEHPQEFITNPHWIRSAEDRVQWQRAVCIQKMGCLPFSAALIFSQIFHIFYSNNSCLRVYPPSSGVQVQNCLALTLPTRTIYNFILACIFFSVDISHLRSKRRNLNKDWIFPPWWQIQTNLNYLKTKENMVSTMEHAHFLQMLIKLFYQNMPVNWESCVKTQHIQTINLFVILSKFTW